MEEEKHSLKPPSAIYVPLKMLDEDEDKRIECRNCSWTCGGRALPIMSEDANVKFVETSEKGYKRLEDIPFLYFQTQLFLMKHYRWISLYVINMWSCKTSFSF